MPDLLTLINIYDMFKLTFRKYIHNFLNIYLREGDLTNNRIRDATWFAIMQHRHITLTVEYTDAILFTSCVTACNLITHGKLHKRNNVYSLWVPEVPFINLLHCVALSVSGHNSVLQMATAVQFALHHRHVSLCLSADWTSVGLFQVRRNPVRPQQFFFTPLHV